MAIKEIIDFLNEQGKKEYALEVAELAGLDTSETDTQVSEDDFEVNYEKFKAGERDPKFIKVLMDEAIAEYKSGGTFPNDIDTIIVEAVANNSLPKFSMNVLQDMYEFLESENFHAHILAIEHETGIEYT